MYVFNPRCGRPIKKLVNPYDLTSEQHTALVVWLSYKVRAILSPQAIYANEDYMDKLLRRIGGTVHKNPGMPRKLAIKYGSWLYFDEVLNTPLLNEKGIYDCVAHYPLLIEAIKITPKLHYSPYSSKVFISGLDFA